MNFRVSKITKKQLRDITVRVFKTFVASGFVAVSGMGFGNPKAWVITFATAGVTAIMNLVVKLFEESEGFKNENV